MNNGEIIFCYSIFFTLTSLQRGFKKLLLFSTDIFLINRPTFVVTTSLVIYCEYTAAIVNL